jgi:dihydrofolate reductase
MTTQLINNNMRKIIAIEWLSLDGYFADSDNGTDWFVSDEQTWKYLLKLFSTFDTIILGKVTYEMFAAYWPNPNPTDPNPQVLIDFMNNSQKVVFTKSLRKVEWNNSVLMKDIILEEINKIKQSLGKNIVIFGSGSIVSQLTKSGVVDEYYFLINPVFLGSGKTLFNSENAKAKLKLLDSTKFDNGNIMLHYQAVKN